MCPAPHLLAPASGEGPAEDARQRLLHTAVRLFAEQGYAQTSTRELAEMARVNVAAISYYFGDKAGLYRATFVELQNPIEQDIALYADPALTLAEALRGFYAGFLEPLRKGELVQQCMKLYFREILEPTGLLDQLVASEVQPNHNALMALLCRHLGLAQPDEDIEGLAICLAWIAVQLHMGREVNERLAPRAFEGTDVIERWYERLVSYGMAMVRAEAARRGLRLKGETN
jgi:AcrR family transcriptional regulator